MLGPCLFFLFWALVASQTSSPSCPKQLGANAPSRPRIPLKGKYELLLQIAASLCRFVFHFSLDLVPY